MIRRPALLPALLVLMGMAAFLAPRPVAAADSNLVVAGAWIRQPPPGSDVAALYLSLQNAGTQAVRLTGVECALAAMAMLHETREAGGQSQMRALDSVSLSPGASIAFSPGGRHIMLHGLAHPLQVGERVPFVLVFAGGIRLHAVALVRPLGSG
ncbi:MAG TPA: copper chaperone PCu(A)C [Steroidobacteraceae bacterium]|nr:copper chaperone PCu(A)C [Steroidobacteraceae bacterium]